MKTTNYLSINNWAIEDRPREKLLQKGKSSLTNSELIAILIGSGSKNQSAVELAQSILRDNEDNLHVLSRQNMSELLKFKGIGEAKAISIIAALELGRRRQSEEALDKTKIGSSKDAFNILSSKLSDLNHEEFWVLLLNRSNKVLKTERISIGGIHGTVVDPKIIFKLALENNSCGVILAHNHPSGSLIPSTEDKNITSKIINAGDFLEIKVLDHLIVAENKYFSFADNDLI